MVTPEPVFSAFIAGAIFCAICGYQRRRVPARVVRRVLALRQPRVPEQGSGSAFSISRAFAFCSRSSFAKRACVFASSCIGPTCFSSSRSSLPGTSGRKIISRDFFPECLSWAGEPGLPRWQFLVLHFAWWFPAIFLILPGLLFAPRKIFRPQEMTFADALPLCWMGVGFLPLFYRRSPGSFSSMSMCRAFALFAACAWERTSRPFRIAGIALALLAGGAIAAMVCFAPRLLRYSITIGTIPGADSRYFRPHDADRRACAWSFSRCPRFFLPSNNARKSRLLLVLASMVPIGLCLAEGASRIAPSFSLAGAARFLNPHLGERGQVLYEGPLHSGSTLTFYLNREILSREPGTRFLRPETPPEEKYLDEHFVLEAWNRSDPDLSHHRRGPRPALAGLDHRRASTFTIR